MAPYRILLADDHTMFRAGVKKMLERMSDVEIVAEASDGLELISLLGRVEADLVLLDISMPKLGGIEAAKKIRKTFPQVKILVLTMHLNKDYFYYSMSAGASGYLLKQDADEELFSAVDKIRAGETYISPFLSTELIGDVVDISRGRGDSMPAPLSPREREVLKFIAEGKTSREIAEVLSLSVRTVEHHRANILKKTKTRSTADLVRFAFQQGYIS